MKMTHSSVAVFLWTFRRKWKGFLIFLGATVLLIFIIIGIYPEFSDLQSQRMAKALGGDIEISLVEDKEEKGNYTLRWSKYGGVDGYVVIESNTDIVPFLVYIKNMIGSDITKQINEFFSSNPEKMPVLEAENGNSL